VDDVFEIPDSVIFSPVPVERGAPTFPTKLARMHDADRQAAKPREDVTVE